jgi:4-hydroxybutyrate CoA-transferase
MKDPIFLSAEEAFSKLKSNDTVYIHSVAMAPQHLIQQMILCAPRISNVKIVHLHTEGTAPYVDAKYQGIFKLHSIFVGSNVRKATQEGLADYIPVFLSESPLLFKKNILPLDVALIQVSPPDKHGYVSIGTSVDATLAAIENAKIVIAQVNKYVPRIHGDSLIHQSMIDFMVAFDEPIHSIENNKSTEIDEKIGRYISQLVEDGATLQMGIGAIPNAVLSNLMNHKNLGIHSEMFSDGVVPLIQKGVINNSQKKIFKHKVVSSFVMGSKQLYDYIDDNPMIQLMPVDIVNDVAVIRKNPKVTAINSALEIDLTGQVCADSIGTKHYSGVGGQIDFMRGACYSEGGKPIIAMPSITTKGISKIKPVLTEGAGVVSTRAHVHYVVTEYGIVNLFGKSLKERAHALISIAHPSVQEELTKAAFERFGGNFY